MTCDDVRGLLAARADGQLAGADAVALEAHLATCPACTLDAARHVRLARELARLPPPRVPENFTSSVMAQLPEMLPAEQGVGHLVRWGLASAACVAAFVLGVALISRAGGPDVAHETLAPLSASLRLDGALLAQASVALARALDAAASSLAVASTGAKAAFLVTFLSSAMLLAACVRGLRAREGELPATRRVSSRRSS